MQRHIEHKNSSYESSAILKTQKLATGAMSFKVADGFGDNWIPSADYIAEPQKFLASDTYDTFAEIFHKHIFKENIDEPALEEMINYINSHYLHTECNLGSCILCRKKHPEFREFIEQQTVLLAYQYKQQNDQGIVYTAFAAGGLLQDFIIIQKLHKMGIKFSKIIIIDPSYYGLIADSTEKQDLQKISHEQKIINYYRANLLAQFNILLEKIGINQENCQLCIFDYATTWKTYCDENKSFAADILVGIDFGADFDILRPIEHFNNFAIPAVKEDGIIIQCSGKVDACNIQLEIILARKRSSNKSKHEIIANYPEHAIAVMSLIESLNQNTNTKFNKFFIYQSSTSKKSLKDFPFSIWLNDFLQYKDQHYSQYDYSTFLSLATDGLKFSDAESYLSIIEKIFLSGNITSETENFLINLHEIYYSNIKIENKFLITKHLLCQEEELLFRAGVNCLINLLQVAQPHEELYRDTCALAEEYLIRIAKINFNRKYIVILLSIKKSLNDDERNYLTKHFQLSTVHDNFDTQLCYRYLMWSIEANCLPDFFSVWDMVIAENGESVFYSLEDFFKSHVKNHSLDNVKQLGMNFILQSNSTNFLHYGIELLKEAQMIYKKTRDNQYQLFMFWDKNPIAESKEKLRTFIEVSLKKDCSAKKISEIVGLINLIYPFYQDDKEIILLIKNIYSRNDLNWFSQARLRGILLEYSKKIDDVEYLINMWNQAQYKPSEADCNTQLSILDYISNNVEKIPMRLYQDVKNCLEKFQKCPFFTEIEPKGYNIINAPDSYKKELDMADSILQKLDCNNEKTTTYGWTWTR